MGRRVLVILAAVILLKAGSVWGFDLNSYQVPDYVEFNLDYSYENVCVFEKFKEVAFNKINSRLEHKYFMGIYKRKEYYVWNHELVLNDIIFGTSDDNILFLEESDSEWNPEFTLNGEYRNYFTDLLFGEIKLSGKNEGLFKKHKDREVSYTYTSVTHEHLFDIAADIGIGIGRIENVKWACQAMSILDELQSAGLLMRKVEDEDIVSLADLLVRLEKIHYKFRTTSKQKNDIQITRRLFEWGLLSRPEEGKIQVLKEMNVYGAKFERRSGWEFTPSFRSKYNYSRQFEKFTTDYINNRPSNRNERINLEGDRFSIGYTLSFVFYHNLDKNMQLNFTANMGYLKGSGENELIINNDRYSKQIYDEDVTEQERNFEISLNKYVNDRLMLQAALSHNYYKIKIDGIPDQRSDSIFREDDPFKKADESFKFSTRTIYYISPSFTLILNFAAINKDAYLNDYNNGQIIDNSINEFECSIGIIYEMF